MNAGIHAFWRRIDLPGHDAARLVPRGDGWKLEGYAAFRENGPTGLRYTVHLAADFATVGATLVGHRAGRPIRHVFRRSNTEGWLDGEPVTGLRDLGYEATLEMAASGFVRLYPDLWEMEPDA